MPCLIPYHNQFNSINIYINAMSYNIYQIFNQFYTLRCHVLYNIPLFEMAECKYFSWSQSKMLFSVLKCRRMSCSCRRHGEVPNT